jgi:hypothetical protein
MLANEIILQGEWTAQGTLQLAGHPVIPVGPVEVAIRPLASPTVPTEDWWQFLQRTRAELEASGRAFRTQEEIDREIEELRADRELLG